MTTPTGRPVDLDAVAQLVEQLERDLARARTGGASVETLQAEVEQLRAALAAGSPSAEDVSQGLVGVRTRLHDLSDELGADALIGADYLARIGRLLGLT
jgi:glycine cleavage system regulatory protein